MSNHFFQQVWNYRNVKPNPFSAYDKDGKLKPKPVVEEEAAGGGKAAEEGEKKEEAEHD